MAATGNKEPNLAQLESLPSTSPPEGGGAKPLLRVLALLVVIVVVVGLGAYGSTLLLGNLSRETTSTVLTHTVQRGELLVTVTEDGNVESASNLDIKCEVAGGSAILWIVEDGLVVEKGDKLVELDQSQLEEQISQQTITTEKARSAMIQAQKDYAVAQIAVKEYLEGIFKQEIQTHDANITIALENLRTAQNTLEHTERMFRKGYVSQLELEGQQFAVQRAQLELDSAKTAKDVLEKFTKLKTMEDLASAVETAKARTDSETAAFNLEDARLTRLNEQLSKCVILAPQSGMAVYANDQSRGRFSTSQGPQIEEGAQVRERQNILRLPDLAQMQVKVNVHETKVESLSRELRARIRIQDREFQGTVTSIANQPEPSSFFSASVKEYATTVRIEGETQGLKPGMTAEVEILIAHLKDAITLPVAAVVEQRGQFFCWVKQADTVQKRPLVLGLSDDQFVEVRDGVTEGEHVLLNPRAVVEEARAEDEVTEDVNVEEKFGGPSPDMGAGPRPEKGGRGGPPEGGDGGRRGPGALGPEGGRRGGGSGGGSGGGGMSNLMESDQDGDGKISKDEVPEFMQRFFDNVDTNGDGFVDSSELAAMQSRRRPGGDGGGRGGGGGGGGGMMRFDQDGDGKISMDEAPEFLQGNFSSIDTNGDGFVDAEEAGAMRGRGGGGEGRGGGGEGRGGGFGGGQGRGF